MAEQQRAPGPVAPQRSRALLLVLVLALVVPLSALLPAPARAARPAAASFGPLEQVSPRTLLWSTFTTRPDGSLWGAARLPEHRPGVGDLALLHRRPAGGWSVRRLALTGRPLAVADDGRSTFVLFSTDGCGRCELRVARVPHGADPTPVRRLGLVDHVAGASLVARDDRWWAVWVAGQGTAYALHEARSFAPAYAPRLVPGAPSGFALFPHLQLRGRTQVLLSLDRPRHVELWSSTGGRPLRRTGIRVRRGPAEPNAPQVAPSAFLVAHGRAVLAVVRGGRLVLAHDHGDLAFRERVVPVPREPGSLHLARSTNGRLLVGHNACFSAPSFTCRGFLTSVSPSGAPRTTDVTAAFEARTDDVRAGLLAVTPGRGRASVVLLDSTGHLWTRTER